ncbi:YppG family protein [Virgibacillus salarius]|nr:YppG family protein [Virgibacillus salarius]
MFPNRQRRSIMRQAPPRRQADWFGRPLQGRNTPKKASTTENIIAQFRDQDGQLDFNKMTEVASQMGKIYGQVSPLITTFFKK